MVRRRLQREIRDSLLHNGSAAWWLGSVVGLPETAVPASCEIDKFSAVCLSRIVSSRSASRNKLAPTRFMPQKVRWRTRTWACRNYLVFWACLTHDRNINIVIIVVKPWRWGEFCAVRLVSPVDLVLVKRPHEGIRCRATNLKSGSLSSRLRRLRVLLAQHLSAHREFFRITCPWRSLCLRGLPKVEMPLHSSPLAWLGMPYNSNEGRRQQYISPSIEHSQCLLGAEIPTIVSSCWHQILNKLLIHLSYFYNHRAKRTGCINPYHSSTSSVFSFLSSAPSSVELSLRRLRRDPPQWFRSKGSYSPLLLGLSLII